MRNFLYSPIGCILLALLLLGIVGGMDFEDEVTQEAAYCEMVKLHKSDPGKGWPDYKGLYFSICE